MAPQPLLRCPKEGHLGNGAWNLPTGAVPKSAQPHWTWICWHPKTLSPINTKRPLGALVLRETWTSTWPTQVLGNTSKANGSGEWEFHCPGATGIGLALGRIRPARGGQLVCLECGENPVFWGSFTEANEKPWGALSLGLIECGPRGGGIPRTRCRSRRRNSSNQPGGSWLQKPTSSP